MIVYPPIHPTDSLPIVDSFLLQEKELWNLSYFWELNLCLEMIFFFFFLCVCVLWRGKNTTFLLLRKEKKKEYSRECPGCSHTHGWGIENYWRQKIFYQPKKYQKLFFWNKIYREHVGNCHLMINLILKVRYWFVNHSNI